MPKKPVTKQKEEKCRTILSYFTNHVNNLTITCPACQESVIKHKINDHLDNECSSRCNTNSNINNQTFGRTNKDSPEKEKPVLQESSSLIEKNVDNLSTTYSASRSTKRKSNLSLKDKLLKNSSECTFPFLEELSTKKQKRDVDSELETSIDSCRQDSETSVTKFQNENFLKDDPLESVHSYIPKNIVLTKKNDLENFNSLTENKNFEHEISIDNTCIDKSPEENICTLKLQECNESSTLDDNSPSSSQNSVPVEEKTFRYPYYLDNFLLVVKAVFTDPHDSLLFNDEDKEIVNKFYNLTDCAKQLYVRLFQRKLKWIPIIKLKYSDIAEDLNAVINELINNNFLCSDVLLNDLPTVLHMLQMPDLKEIVKTFNLVPGKFQKQIMIDQILKYAKQQKLIFAAMSKLTNEQIILKKAKSLLHTCIKINNDYRQVFQRAIILFSLTSYSSTNDDEISGNQQLLTVLLVNMRKLIFPPYDVLRERQLFEDREEFLRYVEACEMETDLMSLMEFHQYEKGLELYRRTREMYQNIQQSHFCEKQFLEIPDFLKRFTVGAVYVRCLSYGVEILQRLKMYSEAVEQLKDLLNQKFYHQDWRGRWTERLVLNLEQHLKLPEEALEFILKGADDSCIRTGHALDLLLRAQRIIKSKKSKKSKVYLEKLPPLPDNKIPEVFIEGFRLPNKVAGCKSYFISQETSSDENQESVICSVEELAKTHYYKLGYLEGIHGESSTPCSIFGLLFWDVIYMSDIPDVFRSPYQAFPLDLNTDDFYRLRHLIIDERLQWIRNSTHDELISNMLDVWAKHENELSLVAWTNFRDFYHLQTLVECIKPKILADICEKYAKDYRHCRSGFPDLIVWNHSESIFKVIEVKGPNDRLSTKQVTWMNFLLSLGVDAEVCHVSAVGAKKLKKMSSGEKRVINKNCEEKL